MGSCRRGASVVAEVLHGLSLGLALRFSRDS